MPDDPQTKDPHKIVLNTGLDQPPAPPPPPTAENGTGPTPPPAPPTDPAPAPGEWVELAALQELVADVGKKQAFVTGFAIGVAALALMVALRAQGTARAALRAAETGPQAGAL